MIYMPANTKGNLWRRTADVKRYMAEKTPALLSLLHTGNLIIFHFNSIIFINFKRSQFCLSSRWATSLWWVSSPLCFSQSSIFSSTKEFTGNFYFLTKFAGILEISGYASIPVQYFKKGKLYHILTAIIFLIYQIHWYPF